VVAVATRLFSDDQLDQLRSFPDIGKDDLIRYFTLAERLTIDPAELQGYGRREQTRTGHLQSAAGYLGWKQAPPGGAAMKELEQFLLDRAMEHDSPALLFNPAAEQRRVSSPSSRWRSC
jgi:hypothetical protein